MDSPLKSARPPRIWSLRGPEGIRSGWSFLIFVLIYGLVSFGLFTLARILFHLNGFPAGEIQPGFALAGEGLQLIPVALSIGIMSRIEGRSVLSYGLAGPVGRRFVFGALGGVATLSILIAILALGGYWAFDGLGLQGTSALAYALVWLLVFTLTGIVEETVWRGYVQTTLARGMGFWPAAVIGSLLFASAHMGNPGESKLGLVQVFVAGLVFCLVFRASGSLWFGIGVHAGWDWGQSYLYGTPDSGLVSAGHLMTSHAIGAPLLSGGSVGPEGSLFSMPVLVLGMLVLLWICRRSGVFQGHSGPSTSPSTPSHPTAGTA